MSGMSWVNLTLMSLGQTTEALTSRRESKAIEIEIEEYEQAYNRFSGICKVRNKNFLFSIIMSEISTVVVDYEKRIVVK